MTGPLVIPFFIPHQGCPHLCSFCNQRVIVGQPGPVPGPKDLETTISTFLSYKGNRDRVELAFFGGNFLGLPLERILDLLGAAVNYLEKGLIHGIRCSTRPDTVKSKILSQVAPLGLDLVELGVQSMDDGVLSRALRGHTRQDTLEAMAHLKAAGFKTGVQLMVGLPGDTPATSLASARAVAELEPDLARIYPVLVLAGSRLAQWYGAGGYRPLSLSAAVDQVKEMVKVLEGEGIPVVRLGLQASEAMADSSQMLAGPWHPAFGHLVRSALVLETVCQKIETRLKAGGLGPRVCLAVHPRAESRLRGQKNANLKTLSVRFPGLSFSVQQDRALSGDRVDIRDLP